MPSLKNTLTKKHNIPIKKYIPIDFTKYGFSKYEKISIGIIIILSFWPLIFSYIILLGGATIGFLIFERLILDPIYINAINLHGYMPLFLLQGNIIVNIGALIGLSFFAIPYYELTNRIFREPHKKRKILIGAILIYVILGNIFLLLYGYCFLPH